MKGFGCIVPGKEVGWIEKPVPEPGPYDALCRPIAAAPCSSDIHNAFEIGSPKLMYGRILGHEAVAEIVKVGDQVADFKEGDRILVPATTPNWRKPSIQDTWHQHTDFVMDSFKYAFYMDGCFAEYFIVPDVGMNAAHLPDGITLEQAVMACDMMPTGLHGAELADIKFGETVVVIGIGPVGLMAVAGAVLRGAGKIYAVGTRPNCVELAKQYGATDIISYKEGNIADQIKKLAGRNGIDKVIIAGGNADTFADAIRIVRPGGIVSNVNFFTGADSLSVPLLAWGSGMSHKDIRGGLCPGGRRRMEKMLALIQNGRIDPGKLVTHRFHGLDRIPEAFQLMKEKPRDLIKPVVFM